MECDIQDVLPSWTCEEYVCEENMERLRRSEKLAQEKGVTVGQINLAWILNQSFTYCPIFSPSSTGHLMDNLKGLDVRLTQEELLWLNLEK